MPETPPDAAARRTAPPVICYPPDTLPAPDLALYARARDGAAKTAELLLPPRAARYPCTNALLTGGQYHHHCHSNLVRALAAETGLTPDAAEPHVHDVLNLFMCTGFARDSQRYFTKASPARAGDHVEVFAEIDLLGALSACPWGDCGTNSPMTATCHPLLVEILAPAPGALARWRPPAPAPYDRSHGL
ncbi:DUF1989 domain-containing protein [Rhodovulum sp.]|uniref:DUF1989 domain-containing protein n=1 Tax=Rhodovulum sp. TaxID=34009 RepID=UPI0018128F11|nr:DUF1989 domain-containing protein [Rhodovulum sp.]HDR29172.1 DUF1989 domain-containing protein [Rhodovulum sp.]